MEYVQKLFMILKGPVVEKFKVAVCGNNSRQARIHFNLFNLMLRANSPGFGRHLGIKKCFYIFVNISANIKFREKYIVTEIKDK